MITGTKYCIFRVGERYKTIKSIKGFEGHMLRTFETPNANKLLEQNNRILKGGFNIVEDVEQYIAGAKIIKNGVIARDLLLTASPEFFKGRSKGFIDRWVQCNMEFLEKHFGENLRFSVLHMDETTPHISALVVPRFENTRGKEQYKLSNRNYFNGKEAMSLWQDKYAQHITAEFKELNRGIKGSRATHIQMKQYYTLVNADLNTKDLKSIIAKAENSILLEKQVKNLQELLRENLKEKENTSELKDMIKDIKQDKEIYRQTIKAISEGYKISQQSILEMVKRVEEKVKGDNVPSIERERSKEN